MYTVVLVYDFTRSKFVFNEDEIVNIYLLKRKLTFLEVVNGFIVEFCHNSINIQ